MNRSSVDEYITKAEFAERMTVTPRTVEHWMRLRKVPYEKIGRTVRFHWGDVRAHLARRSRIKADPHEHVGPTDGLRARLNELAAAIRNRQPAKTTGTGGAPINMATPVL
jgi:excisionase family DNA binding protein